MNCHTKLHYNTKTGGWDKNKSDEYWNSYKIQNPNLRTLKNLQHSKKRYIERRKWLENVKKNLKCSICKEDHPAVIVFHHRNPKQKKTRISRMISGGYSLKTILEEIAKCDALCMNCHFKLHAKLRREKK